jgi:hypothetical protein
VNPVGMEPPRAPPPAGTSSTTVVWIIVAALFGLLLVCGLGGAVGFLAYKRSAAGLSSAGSSLTGAATTRSFTSRDGIVSLVAPSNWKPIGGDDVSAAVDLGICSAAEDVLVFNVNESSGDFEHELLLGGYADIVKNLYRENMRATFHDGETMKLAGYPAVRFPFEGSYGGIRLRGFLFALKSPKNFHHLVVATVPSDYDRLIGTGLRVVSTMTVVTPNGAPSAPPPAASRL